MAEITLKWHFKWKFTDFCANCAINLVHFSFISRPFRQTAAAAHSTCYKMHFSDCLQMALIANNCTCLSESNVLRYSFDMSRITRETCSFSNSQIFLVVIRFVCWRTSSCTPPSGASKRQQRVSHFCAQ